MKAQTLPSVHVVLKPSIVILGCYFLISILSCISIYISSMSMVVKALSIAIVASAFAYIVMRDALLILPWSWHAVSVTSLGELRLENRKKEIVETQLLPSTFNHPFLTVLNFKRTSRSSGWRNSVMLTPWHVIDPYAYRQLRVWLKWWPHQIDLAPVEVFDE